MKTLILPKTNKEIIISDTELRGTWKQDGCGGYYCDACRAHEFKSYVSSHFNRFRFCPSCGALMVYLEEVRDD